MRIFFVGDVVGKPGRKLLAEQLPLIRERFRFDVAIANGENAAGGNGLTKNMADELFRAGIDAITMGDHVWDQRCFENEIGSIEKLCRPALLYAVSAVNGALEDVRFNANFSSLLFTLVSRIITENDKWKKLLA